MDLTSVAVEDDEEDEEDGEGHDDVLRRCCLRWKCFDCWVKVSKFGYARLETAD